ncbi:MAG TPA: hypothetical protein DD433_07710 [Ruminococcaceae bacterium]|nr:hypothetical protein [Oscillospiraceae bacterium]
MVARSGAQWRELPSCYGPVSAFSNKA